MASDHWRRDRRGAVTAEPHAGPADGSSGSVGGVVRATVRRWDTVLEVRGRLGLRLDARGRWCTYRHGGRIHRRTLDGAVVERAGGMLRVHEGGAARTIHLEVQALTRWLGGWVDTGGVELARGTTPEQLRARLEDGARWGPEEHAADARAFHDTYPEPVSILPPDRYRDVVVQPAVGCPHARCGFCAFYRDRPFRVIEPQAFSDHLERIERFFGPALEGRQGIFLGSASALSLSQPRLLAVLSEVSRKLGRLRRGFGAFADPDHVPTRGASELAELVAAGLEQVTVGLETAHPMLRRALGKSDHVAGFAAMAAALKQAGVQVAITILVGIPGADEREHRGATAAFVSSLPLERRDIVYLSPVGGADLEDEIGAYREEIGARTVARVAPYRISLFRYFG